MPFTRKCGKIHSGVSNSWQYGTAGWATADSMAQRGEPQLTVWRHMHIGWWVPEATETQAEYVMFIVFSQQQWWHDRASMLHYTYIACVVTLYCYCVLLLCIVTCIVTLYCYCIGTLYCYFALLLCIVTLYAKRSCPSWPSIFHLSKDRNVGSYLSTRDTKCYVGRETLVRRNFLAFVTFSVLTAACHILTVQGASVSETSNFTNNSTCHHKPLSLSSLNIQCLISKQNT
jgi:hypothetical protein